jgi:hypothetical protein
VVSTDARVEGVHFRWRTDRRAPSARPRSLRRSPISPRWARGRAGSPARSPRPNAAARGFDGSCADCSRARAAHACPLVGGNLARASETSIVITVFGGVARGRALRAARAIGDRILVTGELGAAALARARAEQQGAFAAPSARSRGSPRAARSRGSPRHRLHRRVGRPRQPTSRTCSGRAGAARSTPRACRCRAASQPAAARSGSIRSPPRSRGRRLRALFAVRPQGPSAAALARRLGVRVSELGRVERGATRARRGFDHFAERLPNLSCRFRGGILRGPDQERGAAHR